jgi:hypothetical protein
MSDAVLVAALFLVLVIVSAVAATIFILTKKREPPASAPTIAPFYGTVMTPGPSSSSGSPSSSGPPSSSNNKKIVIFGTYRSEEHEHWTDIYDPDKTLGPLGMKGHRIQLSIRHKSDAGDSKFHSVYEEDGRVRFKMDESQEGILDLIKKACGGSVEHIMVTIGLPKFKKHPKENLLGTPEWKKDWMSLCTDVAAQLKGKCGIVEIFGEPDLDWLKTHYSHAGPEKIADAVGIAIEIFRAAGHANVGGCGAGDPDKPWMDVFLGKIQPFKPDFVSYHGYLNMTDAATLSDPKFKNERNRIHTALIDKMNRAGIPESTPIILSEYGFQEADFNKAIDVSKHTMTNYKNGARSLESWALVHDLPRISHVYVAQGVGQAYFNPAVIPGFKPWSFSMYPMVIWDPKDGHKYRASYWAWAMLMRIVNSGKPWTFNVDGDVSSGVGVDDKSMAVMWNRSGRALETKKPIDVAGAGQYRRIDSKTFPHDFKNPDSIVKEVSRAKEPPVEKLEDIKTLENEGVVFYEKDIFLRKR